MTPTDHERAILPTCPRLLLPLVLALALLAACTQPGPDATITAPADESAPADEGPAVGDDPVVRDAPPDEDAAEDDGEDGTTGLVPCGEGDRDRMVAAVDGQLDAIGDGDWERALGFATPGFRSSTDAATFESVILDGFPVLADASGRDLGACSSSPDGQQASMLVVVTGEDGAEQTLLYLFAEVDGGWSIDGAVPQGAGPGGGEPTITA